MYLTGLYVGKQIEDYWNVDGENELSVAWTGFARLFYERKGHRTDIHGPGERLTRKQKTSRSDDVWPDMWKFMSDAAKKESKAKIGYRETRARQCQTIERNILY